jgi:dihydrolipoamide dehydrogenase
VTVVEYLDRICPGVDRGRQNPAALAEQARHQLQVEFESHQRHASASVQLSVEPAAGGTAELLEADYVLVAIGRRPYTRAWAWRTSA